MTREQLKKLLKQILSEVDIHGQVSTAVREEVARLQDEDHGHGPGPTSYVTQIMSGRDHRQRRELPEAARVFARLGLVTGLSAGDHSQEIELARTLDVEAQYKQAQSDGSAEGGGLLLIDDMAAEIIELLRPFSVVRQIGPRLIGIPRGTLRTPKITAGVSSAYVGEGKAIPAGKIKVGQITLQARKLAALVVFTNELRTFAGDIDGILLDDMLASIGQTEDVAFLFGSGSENEPMGITEWVIAANVFDATQIGGTATLTEVQTDLQKAENLLLSADVPMRRPVWIMSHRSRLFLRDLRDTQDRGAFADEMRQARTVNGIPYFTTNNVPNNLGSGTNESKVILVDASEVVIGDVEALGIDRSDSAVIKIDGTDTSLFESDMSAVRLRMWNDLVLRHDVSAAVIEAIKWGD